MKIYSRFDSIQGEGVHAGVSMFFIRLVGCNLKCKWCDTKKARNVRMAIEVPVSEICVDLPHKWICITGGEPLVQADELASLVLNLKCLNHKIEIETNGSIDPPLWAFTKVIFPQGGNPIDLVDSWVVDIKLSSSGNPSSANIIGMWARHMRSIDQFKLVVANVADLREAEEWIKNIITSPATVLISPVMPRSEKWKIEIAEFCKAHNVRMSLQLHKIIWGDKENV